MNIPSFQHTRSLADYSLARDANEDGRIQKHEILDTAELGKEPLRGEDLDGLFLKEKSLLSSWKPSAGWHVAAGVVPAIRVSDRVVSIDPEANLVILQREARFPEPSQPYMHL